MSLDIFGAGGIASFAQGVVNKIWPDATEKVKAQEVATEAATQVQQYAEQAIASQVAVNLADAQSESRFKSWARPAFLWLGVAILAMRFLIAPFLSLFHVTFAMPDDTVVMNLVFGLLGIYGSQRTVEKLAGKQ